MSHTDQYYPPLSRTCPLGNEIKIKDHFEVSLPQPTSNWLFLANFNSHYFIINPRRLCVNNMCVEQKYHFMHLVPVAVVLALFHDARSAWLEKLFKHLWPVVGFFFNTVLAWNQIMEKYLSGRAWDWFGYAAFCTEYIITQGCPSVAALSRRRQCLARHCCTYFYLSFKNSSEWDEKINVTYSASVFINSFSFHIPFVAVSFTCNADWGFSRQGQADMILKASPCPVTPSMTDLCQQWAVNWEFSSLAAVEFTDHQLHQGHWTDC